MYKRTDCKNGLRVVTHEIKDRDSVAIGFWVGVGGRHESDELKGAAHFLEHMVFKGSKKYSCDEIKINIEGIGGGLNAFTSEEHTCYYAKIPSKHIDKTFDVLADMVFFPKIDKKDVEKERTVIIEEIKMYHDLPQYYVMELLDEIIWPNHPLGKSLAGTIETVSKLSRKELQAFHQRHYSPQNIVVSACGNISHKKIVDLVQKKLKSIKGVFQSDCLKYDKEQNRPKAVYCERPIEQMHVALGLHSYDHYHKDRFALSLLNVILGGNMSSRLFTEIREKRGLAYSIYSNTKMLRDTGVFLIKAGVDNRKLVSAIEVILLELKKIKTKRIMHAEFERARDYLLGQLMLGLEDTMDHMLWIGESILNKDKTKTLDNVVKDFKKVTVNDVARVANDILKPGKMNLAVVGPITPQQKQQINDLLNVK